MVAEAAGSETADGHMGSARLKGWKPSKTACAIVGTELVCAIIVAWVVSASIEIRDSRSTSILTDISCILCTPWAPDMFSLISRHRFSHARR